jgi:maleylacetoacetate isomerase
MNAPRLYTYYRSGAAHRVRIGLALKGVSYESVPVHLVRNGGEHLLPPYRAINPQARVPAMQLSDGAIMAQSPAILEYLEETIPQPPFLPRDPIERAQVRRVAAIIGCDIHPLNNVGPLSELRRSGWSDAQVSAWINKWIGCGISRETTRRRIACATRSHPRLKPLPSFNPAMRFARPALSALACPMLSSLRWKSALL